jgi:murein DD-endopeptidase MepM/ murein hydrolase activator NlpD
MSRRRPLVVATALAVALAASGVAHVAAAADPFSYAPPGQLVPGSGKGRVDMKIYAPEMRFPMESGPAYANSQVWGHGGNSGPGGGQCDKENFSYPWHDNYCESRSWDMPLCPSGNGHQGQDIRAASCVKGVHWVVAAVDGTITNVGSYSVYLTAADGTRYDYLHMQDVQVKEGQKVKREEHLGKVGNQFNGEATTVHLHFNIKQNIAGVGSVYVPTYLSLVESYETMLGLNVKDAGPEAAPPKPPTVAETPVTETSPTEPPPPEPEASEPEGCTFSPASTSGSGRSTSFGTALALLAGALGLIAARRRR